MMSTSVYTGLNRSLNAQRLSGRTVYVVNMFGLDNKMFVTNVGCNYSRKIIPRSRPNWV
jgi:hypothetical protein